jgi:hypothetical protein
MKLVAGLAVAGELTLGGKRNGLLLLHAHAILQLLP